MIWLMTWCFMWCMRLDSLSITVIFQLGPKKCCRKNVMFTPTNITVNCAFSHLRFKVSPMNSGYFWWIRLWLRIQLPWIEHNGSRLQHGMCCVRWYGLMGLLGLPWLILLWIWIQSLVIIDMLLCMLVVIHIPLLVIWRSWYIYIYIMSLIKFIWLLRSWLEWRWMIIECSSCSEADGTMVGTWYLQTLHNFDFATDYGWRSNMEKSTLSLASLKPNTFGMEIQHLPQL
jgi:hypothetical protein